MAKKNRPSNSPRVSERHPKSPVQEPEQEGPNQVLAWNAIPVGTPDPPVIWVDSGNIGLRADAVLFRFFTVFFEKKIESVRIATNHGHAKQLIDSLAHMLDYYPVKDKVLEGTATSKEPKTPQ